MVIFQLTAQPLFFVIHIIGFRTAVVLGLFLPSEHLCLQIMFVQARLHLCQLAVHFYITFCLTVNNCQCEGMCILLNNTCVDGRSMWSGCRMQSYIWTHWLGPFVRGLKVSTTQKKMLSSSETFRGEPKMYPARVFGAQRKLLPVSVSCQTWQLSTLKARRQTGEQIITFPR